MDTDLLVFDVDPASGNITPVLPEHHHLETEGYSVPPVPMSRPQRRRWQKLLKKYRKTMSPAHAWYRATYGAGS
jgi:hypothetical protein